MWPRIVEIVLGAWLVASSFLWGPADDAGGGAPGTTLASWFGGLIIVALSTASFTRRFHRSHLGNLAVAAFLIAWGWSQTPRPGPPGAQNLILTGLILALFAVAPTGANRPPEGWRRYLGGSPPDTGSG